MSFTEKHKTGLWIILNSLFFLFCAFIVFKLAKYHFHLITHPYSIEYREGESMAFTQLMSNAKDPFALAYQPSMINNFGIGYNWVMWPFVKIFGSSYLIYRLITAVCLLSCLGLLIVYLRNQKVSWSLVAAGTIAYYAALLYPGTTTVVGGPAGMGTVLMLAAVCIAYFDQYRWRSLILSAFLSILAFYTKLYFLMGGVILAAYLFLFIDRKKGLLFGMIFAGLLSISIFVMNKCFETYFSSTFFVALNSADFDWGYLGQQIKMFGYVNRNFLIPWMLVMVVVCFKKYKECKMFMHVHTFCFLFTALVMGIRMGGGRGQFMAYYVQLIAPWLIICALIQINRFQWSRILCIILTVIVYCSLNYSFDWSAKDTQAWEEVRALVKEHKDILNTPIVVSFLVDNHSPIYDDGGMEFSKYGTARDGIWGKFLKPYVPLYFRNIEFFQQMQRDVMNKKFDLILITPWSHLLFPEMQGSYSLLNKYSLRIPHVNEVHELFVLVPKP